MSAAKEIREKYLLTQSEMARYLGISRTMLSTVEIGKRDLPIDALKKLNVLAINP